jgi:hypothetical protein
VSAEPPSDAAPVVPEVHVRSVRRRRTAPPLPEVPRPPHLRNWVVYGVLVSVTTVLMLDGFLRDSPQRLLPALSQATEVRSVISQSADSLRVVVSWDLTLSDSAGKPDSIRVKVIPQQSDSVVSFQAADQLADTVYLAAPAAGQTVRGTSCVTAEHPADLLDETCTPWQYVRPLATAETTGAGLSQIIIQPVGLQVDPDIDGKCAEWQRTHPTASVWISVNREAVPECTGPNAKPMVAQFCAFLVLPDGRRVKAANSANNSYCNELFEEWIRERYS